MRGIRVGVAMWLLVGVGSAGAGSIDVPVRPIYQNDSEGAVGAEWSDTTVGVTPIDARSFVGPFQNEELSLTHDGLPPHSRVGISLDLFAIFPWDGNKQDFANNEPDIFTILVEDGPVFLYTTFANVESWQNSYPGSYPLGHHSGYTGPEKRNTLGYLHISQSKDAVYELSFAFHHSSDTIRFLFQPSANVGTDTEDDERWRLDNVNVVGDF